MPGLFKSIGNFFTGTPGKFKQKSLLSKEQEPLQQQLINAGMQQGAGGAFGESADYYRNLLGNNPEDLQAFAAPEMRRFNEEIIPGISEQFAGMGAGGLSSSGFRNAAVNAGTDLSERLAAIRANLRAQGAAGLANIGQLGLNPRKENIYMQGQPGFLQSAGSGLGNAIAQYGGNQNWFGGNPVAKNSSPYGNQGYQPQPFPNFNPNMR